MSQTQSAGFVIRRHDPRRARVLAVVTAVALLAAAALGFWFGLYLGADERASVERYRAVMTDLQDAYGANARLRERIAALERSEQVARNANAGLRDQIAGLQEQLAAVRGDLSLYQGLAAAGTGRPGLGVHQIVVTPTLAPHVFEFTLTLMQNLENARIVSGDALIYLEGSRGGEPARLGLGQLMPDAEDRLAFSFKYFQLLEGSLTLPEDFRPGRVVVRLDPADGGENETVVADFDWSAVVKPARERAQTGAIGP